MKKIALCIGNNDYEYLAKLSFAVNDAKAISEKLQNIGFDVICKTNLTLRDMAYEIGAFAEQIDNSNIALFYYSGHGGEINKTNLLLPVDFELPRNTCECEQTALQLDSLLKKLESHKEKQKIIILDACRSEIQGTRSGTSLTNFGASFAPEGTLIAYSASPGQYSFEGEIYQHGIYTYILLEHISTPRVPIETVLKMVRESLAQRTNYRQISWEHTSLIGDCYLNPGIMSEGIFYSEKALADRLFVYEEDDKIREIIEDLKSFNWYTQNSAIEELKRVDLTNLSADVLFVLGRNIYQAACGEAYSAQDFILELNEIMSSFEPAKVHLLNGMAYEIYFNHENKIRDDFKDKFAIRIISLLEQKENYSSAAYIANVLKAVPERIIYIPSYSGLISFSVEISEDDSFYSIESITLQGTPLSIKPVEGYHGSGLHSLAPVQEKIRHIIAKSIVAPIENMDIRLTGVDVSSNSKRLRVDSHIILKR